MQTPPIAPDNQEYYNIVVALVEVVDTSNQEQPSIEIGKREK